MPKKIIKTKNAPSANGCYSQGILANGFLFISGQLPIEPESKHKLVDKDITDQTHRVLNNIKAIVEEAGGSLQDIVKVTIYLSNINNWSKVNAVYEQFFNYEPPARCVLEIANIHYGFKIEAEAIAYIE